MYSKFHTNVKSMWLHSSKLGTDNFDSDTSNDVPIPSSTSMPMSTITAFLQVFVKASSEHHL